MSKFQIILLAVFGAFIVVGVAVFSLYRGSSASQVPVVVWGDIPTRELSNLLNTATLQALDDFKIRYEEKSNETIIQEFTEALALGKGPDLIIITQDAFWKERQKLLPIPFSSLGEREFMNEYIEEGELFLSRDGIYALPISIDPMVLYYNRDLLNAAGQAQPIRYWDEIYASASNLSKRDAAGNLVTSVIAMGESRNIPNSKDVLSLLMLQAGTPITAFFNNELRSVILSRFDLPVSPGESALDFYTQFSNPTRTYYSWNRSLPDAQTHFTSGDSAYYLGFASEYATLRNKNPNLNLGLATVPQSRVSATRTTFGRIRGVAISRGSRNVSAALSAAMILASKPVAQTLSTSLGLPPARRDLLSERASNATMATFYEAALQSKGWLDPDPVGTKLLFNTAVDAITSGRERTADALGDANNGLEELIK